MDREGLKFDEVVRLVCAKAGVLLVGKPSFLNVRSTFLHFP